MTFDPAKHRRDLVGQIKRALRDRTGPQISYDQARRVGRGSELIPATEQERDEQTIHQWAFRSITGDRGAYISPTEEYFQDLVDTNGLVVTRDIYTGANGNIKYRAGATGGLFILFTGRVYVSETRKVRLDIQTNDSLWIAVDNVTELDSGNLGPNQHSNAVLEMDAGTHTIDIGLYAQSGDVHFRMLGDLAGQVDVMLPAPETDPPAAPTGLAATTDTQVDESAKSVVNLTWTANTEDDLAAYALYRKESAGGTYQPLATLEARAGADAYQDVDVVTGQSYYYAIRAIDTVGNVSAIHEMATNPVTAGDSTGPGDITGMLLNASSISLNTDQGIDSVTARFEWTNPADSDLRRVKIYVARTSIAIGKPAGAFGSAYEAASIFVDPSGSGSFEYTHFNATEGGSGSDNVVWFFFETVDRAGNPTSTSPLPYVRVTFTEIIVHDKWGLVLVPDAAPNKNGWWNADFGITFGFNDPESESILPVQVHVAYPAEDEGGHDENLADSDTYNITTETDADGHTFSAYAEGTRANTNTGRTDVVTLRVRLDKTAPTAPSGLILANTVEGIKLTWSEGSDALSGLQETYIYRNTTNDSGTATLIGKVIAGVTQFVDTDNLETDATYYYWLKHTDQADNLSAFSTGANVKRLHPGAIAFTNWLDNASFERDDPAGAETFASWTDTGTPSTSTAVDGRHGSRHILLSNTAKVTQTVPLAGKYWMFSMLARCGTTGRKAQIVLSFKDITGTELTSVTLSTPTLPSGADLTLYSDDGTTEWVIGPSGSDAPNANEYDPNATTVDVTIQGDVGTVEVDAIHMQEVVTPDAGATWNSFENGDEAPTTFYDSRVANFERINAYVGRFAQLYANNIQAGTINGNSGGFTINLNTGDIDIDLRKATFTIGDATHPIEMRLTSGGVELEQNSITYIGQVGIRVTEETAFNTGSDGDVSGSIEVTALEGFAHITVERLKSLRIISAMLYQDEGSSVFRMYTIERKTSTTSPGHGYCDLRSDQGSSPKKVYLDYSVYNEDSTHTSYGIAVVIGYEPI